MTIVAIVVYDRFDNVREWIRCVNMCQKGDWQLVVIHNYENEDARNAYKTFCDAAGVYYIPRVNVGYDIGALQDVFAGRLAGFPAWDYLLWCCDDTLPMHPDFTKWYLSNIAISQVRVGVVALELSSQVRLHIRTTGFMIRKEFAANIVFPADPITTKEQCYQFEHRDKNGNTFLEQVNRLGYQAVQVAPLDKSPLWDYNSPHGKVLKRMDEHYKVFPKPLEANKKVLFICLVFESYPEIISSLINQTYPNWELLLVHDGTANRDYRSIIEATNDGRIHFIETIERKGNWGHYWRKEVIEKLKDPNLYPSDFIVITNADNHYVPPFCEYMVKGIESNKNAVASYCSQMVHSYIAWGVIQCKLQQGYVDCGGVMLKREAAVSVGWNNIKEHSADWLFFQDVISKYGANSFVQVRGCLLIHN